MATESGSRRRQPSRLQRRAPASIHVNRSNEWNVAIPLLSPVASPPAPFDHHAAQTDSRKDGFHHASAGGADQKQSVVFKKWQVAPFSYDSGSLNRR